MRGGELAGVHHLHAGIEQPCRGAPFLAAGVDEHDDAARRLLSGYELGCPPDEALDAAPFPQRWHGLRLRIPRLDLVRHGPERAERLALEFAVVRLELRRVLDVGAADDVLAFHAGDSTARDVMRCSIQCMRASAAVLSVPKSSTPPP